MGFFGRCTGGCWLTQAKEQDCLYLDWLVVCWLLLSLPVYHCLTCSSLCRVLTPDHWSKRRAGCISVDSCHEPFKNAMCCEEIFIKGSPLVHLYQVLRSPSHTPKFCKPSKEKQSVYVPEGFAQDMLQSLICNDFGFNNLHSLKLCLANSIRWL